MLMGATLPAMSRWVEATPDGVSWLGFFYGGNIGGGVIGSLLAGFYLLRVHDTAFATFVAVGLNVLRRGARAARWRGRRRTKPSTRSTPARRAKPAPGAWAVYVTIALSGMTALARGSDLDAHAVAAVRRDGLHLLADPRRVPARHRHRQQRRLGGGARHRAAACWRSAGARCCCAARLLDGVHADAVAAVLADQPVARDRARGSTSSSISCAACGRCCRPRSCGARASRWRSPSVASRGAGSGAAGRRRLRGQHGRRDRRIRRRQPAARDVARQPARPAGC